MDDDPPTLTIAAENSEQEVRKQRAIDQLEWPTREMAANLFRVMRGAGRPHELPQQIINLSDAILEASKLSNAWGIWSEMEKLLQSAVPTHKDFDDEDFRPAVISGSLQVCASRLVYQTTHINRGFSEINDGIRLRVDVLAQRRMESEAEAGRERGRRAVRKPQPKKVRARPPAPRPKPAPAAEPARSEPMTTAEAMRRRAEELRKPSAKRPLQR